MYFQLFNMNKCCLKNELERKINMKPMGGSLGNFGAFLFLSARLQKSARVKEQIDGEEGAGREEEVGYT